MFCISLFYAQNKSLCILWYWIDLYLRFGLKIAQENQVQEIMFADSSTDVWTKYLDSESCPQGHLLMSRWCPDNEFVCRPVHTCPNKLEKYKVLSARSSAHV